MKDLNSLMKQAQAMQQRMAEAQEKIAAISVESFADQPPLPSSLGESGSAGAMPEG